MLTQVAAQMTSPVLVGRAGQLAALETALAEATRGRPSVIMVGGEAGVGKSRLVREFARTKPERREPGCSSRCS
jgi:predicted ATPase